MTSDKIMDGRVDFELKLFWKNAIAYINIIMKLEILT